MQTPWLVSVLSLQTAMLVSFKEGEELDPQMMNGLTGAGEQRRALIYQGSFFMFEKIFCRIQELIILKQIENITET